jgi:vitamin B12 transporter
LTVGITMKRTRHSILILLLLMLMVPPAMAAGMLDGETVVLDSKDITELNVRSLEELLNLVPGVKAGSSSVSIKGDSSVAVFLDGMSLINTASAHRSVKWNLVSLEDIASLKIIKGGGAVAFGDNAAGGVILIKSKKVDRTQASLEFEAGNQNYWRARGSASRKAGPWGVAFNGDFYSTDGYRRNGDKDDKRAGFKLTYAPESWFLWAGAGAAAPTFAIDYGETRKSNPGLPKYPTPHARSRDEALGTSLNFKALGWENATSFTRFQNDYANPDSSTYTKLRSWTIKEDLRKSFKLPLVGLINSGLLLAHTEAQGNKVLPVDEQSFGIFGQKILRFRAVPVTLNLGLRANVYSEFDSAINPEAKAIWRKGGFRVEAAFQMTNNTPTIRQRYYETYSTKPNPGLGMERATNYSLGASFSPFSWCTISTTAFYNRVSDRITYMRGDDGKGRYENVGEARLSGMDAFMSLKPFEWLIFRPSYTYLEAINDDTGLWLSAKPRHKIKADLQLRPIKGLMFGLLATYCSEVYTNASNTSRAPDYYILDLRGEYRLKQFRLFFRIENMLDEEYLYADGYPAPPRTWRLGMGWDF